jgi:hypothetical protein
MSVTCPFCSSSSVKLVSLFGSQLLLSQYRCGACGTYFEGLRADRWDADPTVAVRREGEGEGDGSPAEH